MNIKDDKKFFNTKIITLILLIAQIALFFLPLNLIKDNMMSVLKAIIDVFSGEIVLTDITSLKVNVILLLSAIALLSNILAFAGIFFVANRKRYRSIGLSFFLSTGIVYAFCWGAMINVSGFVNTLYGFNFLALVISVLMLVLFLKLPEIEIIRKEL